MEDSCNKRCMCGATLTSSLLGHCFLRMSVVVPVIDLSCGDKEVLYHQWDEAFSSLGCCILIGHGLEEKDFSEVKSEASSFFSQPLDTKMKYNFGPYGNEKGGYTPSLGEAVSLSNVDDIGHPKKKVKVEAKSDPVESFIIQHHNCLEYTDILPLSTQYFKKCEDLVHKLHVISSRALGIPEVNEIDYFRKFYDATDERAVGSGVPSFVLRMAHYPPDNSKIDQSCNSEKCSHGTRYGAHTDYMGFTVLRPDEGDWDDEVDGSGGLEIYDAKLELWIKVVLPEEMKKTALIINAGDLLQRWTNDRWVSPLHKVTGAIPFSSAAAKGRTSLVFFSGPMSDALISVCPACSDSSEGQQTRYAPVLAQDYLNSKLLPTALKVDNNSK